MTLNKKENELDPNTQLEKQTRSIGREATIADLQRAGRELVRRSASQLGLF